MTGYRFLRSRRWLGIVALTVLVATVCVNLGFWQLHRHEQRAEAIATVQANSDQAPVPLTDLLLEPSTPVGEHLEWRAVTVSGHYLARPVALPQRGVENAAADHALGVLAVTGAGGQTWLIAVDRGWYPTDAFVDPTDRLALPEGSVTVVIRLRPAEPPSAREAVPGQVFRIDPEQVLQAALDGDAVEGELVTSAYGSLVSESPTTANPPTPLGIPAPNYRSNLSYAFQWWTFGLLAFVGFAVLARRERIMLDGAAPTPAPRPRRRTDADAEDAEIEAALALARESRPTAQASDTSSV